jgi:hypothetical protein
MTDLSVINMAQYLSFMENFLAPTHSGATPSAAGAEDIRNANALFWTREVNAEKNPCTADEERLATIKKNSAFAFIF